MNSMFPYRIYEWTIIIGIAVFEIALAIAFIAVGIFYIGYVANIIYI